MAGRSPDPRRPDPDQVKARLAAAAPSLIATLLPGGRMAGREYRAKGPDGSTWAVVMSGDKAGCWLSGSAGLQGRSFLSLVRDLAAGGDHKAGFRWALAFLGDGEIIAPTAAPAARVQPARQPGDAGKGIYLHAAPFDWANPVGQYLQGRGLDSADFPWPPGSLRYHRALWNAEMRDFLPGMVAPVMDPNAHKQIGLHRTYLARVGTAWRKAPVNTPKMAMGQIAGGIIPLTRGASRRPWGKAPDGDRLLLAEGIENALAVAGEEPDYRAASYVAANNLLRLELPAVFRTICLVVDRDGENWSVTEDRDIAIEQWRLEGRTVETWLPPERFKDAADWRAAQSRENVT